MTNLTNDVVLSDETASKNDLLPDKTDSAVTPELQLSKSNSSSSDMYPDRTATTAALPEATVTTSVIVSTETAVGTTSSMDEALNTSDKTTTVTKNVNDTGNFPDATVDVLHDETTSLKSAMFMLVNQF